MRFLADENFPRPEIGRIEKLVVENAALLLAQSPHSPGLPASPGEPSRSGLYIQSATMDPWSFPGSNGTMTTSSISQGTNSARRRWRKSSPAATRSGAPARSVTSHWVRRSTAVWLSSYFAAYPEDESE